MNKFAILALLLALVACQQYYKTSLAKKLTFFAAITYQSQSSILNWDCDFCKDLPFVNPSIVKNDSNSVFGFIGYSPEHGKIVIAFRGSVDLANWILNLKTTRTSYPLCDGCSVHVGFNQGFNSVKSQVEASLQILRSKYPLATIMVTGHSLGGALAVMAAAHLQNKYHLVEMLYTQGQPRVGNDKFAKFMTTFVPNTYRIVHYADQVPHIPQSILGFKHSGWQIWYERGMQNFSICPSQSKDCSNQLNILQVTQADHKMVLYLQLRVIDSFLGDLSSSVKFSILRYLYKDRIFNLDMATMLEEDRQVKEWYKSIEEKTIVQA